MSRVPDKLAQFLPEESFNLISAHTMPDGIGGTITIIVAHDPPKEIED